MQACKHRKNDPRIIWMTPKDERPITHHLYSEGATVCTKDGQVLGSPTTFAGVISAVGRCLYTHNRLSDVDGFPMWICVGNSYAISKLPEMSLNMPEDECTQDPDGFGFIGMLEVHVAGHTQSYYSVPVYWHGPSGDDFYIGYNFDMLACREKCVDDIVFIHNIA